MIVRGAIVHEPALIALAAEPMAGSHAPYLQQPEAFAEEPRPILRRFQPMGTSHVNGGTPSTILMPVHHFRSLTDPGSVAASGCSGWRTRRVRWLHQWSDSPRT